MATEKQSSIIINLSKTSSPSALPYDSFLHQRQYNTFYHNIADTLNHVPAFKKSLAEKDTLQMGYSRVHDVITIHGQRGSGKTTFLLSALGLLKDGVRYNEYKKEIATLPELKPQEKLCILDIIDPTLFAATEHLLHIVLYQISKKIHAHKKKSVAFDCNGGESCSIEQWHKKLTKLAKGLQAVGEIREDSYPQKPTEPRWKDADFTLQHDLESVQSSMDLEQDFHAIIHDALKILGKEAFVLALDDTDTRPRVGWHILEVLRRYFTTPQLIVVVSGDMDLFSAIIRQKHTEELGLSIESTQCEASPYKERIDTLTEQYLLKILRSQKRVNIGNFASAIEYTTARSTVLSSIKAIKNADEEKSLQELLNVFFAYISCAKKYEQSLFIRALLNHPCRTVLQILDALYDKSKNANFDLPLRLCEIFYTQIQSFGLNPFYFLEQLQGPHGITMLMKSISLTNENKMSFELLPRYADESYNATAIVLQACLTQASKNNPGLMLNYLFKACLLREIQNTPEMLSANYKNIHEYLALDEENPLHKVVENMAALSWLQLRKKEPLCKYGMLRLYSESITKNTPNAVEAMYGSEAKNITLEKTPEALKTFKSAFQNISPPLGTLINTPESLYNNISSWHKYILHVGFLRIKIASSEFQFFSIFTLLAIMGDIVSAKNTYDIGSLLLKATEIKTFNPFSPEKTDNIYFEEEQDAKNYDEEYSIIKKYVIKSEDTHREHLKDFHLLISRLEKWKNEFTKYNNIILTVFPRILTRYFDALKGISDSTKNSDFFLGAHIHRCLVAFFNSVLLEEVSLLNIFRKNRHMLNYNNAITSDDVFCTNIKHIFNEEEFKDSLFYHIFTCPLWELYLNDSSEGDQSSYYWFRELNPHRKNDDSLSFIQYISFDENKDDVHFDNFYPLLNSIAIPKSIVRSKIVEQAKVTEEGKKAGLIENPKNFDNTRIYAYLKKFDKTIFHRLSDERNFWDFCELVERFYKDPALRIKFQNEETFTKFLNFIKRKL